MSLFDYLRSRGTEVKFANREADTVPSAHEAIVASQAYIYSN